MTEHDVVCRTYRHRGLRTLLYAMSVSMDYNQCDVFDVAITQGRETLEWVGYIYATPRQKETKDG